MSLPTWREEPIAKKHDRASFDCGEPALNEFLRRHARQSHDKGAAKTFLAVSQSDGKTILGFYSLSPASLEYARTPEVVRIGLARHDVSVFRLGRLAVSRAVQGQGLGGQLILAAGRRCLLAATEVGGVALLIDAKNERAAKWYSSYGAISLEDAPLSLLLPLATISSGAQVRWQTRLSVAPHLTNLSRRGMRVHDAFRDVEKAGVTAWLMHFGALRTGWASIDSRERRSATTPRQNSLRQPCQQLGVDCAARADHAGEPCPKTAIDCKLLQFSLAEWDRAPRQRAHERHFGRKPLAAAAGDAEHSRRVN